jgi:hypothetical protein
VPWLSNEQLKELENLGVSGIDLCGNGIITVPPELFVLRSGSPNKYRASRLIKRVYRGVSSLVARVFLMRPKFNSVSEILDEIIQREGKTTLPTVSKALSQLEEDLVVDRSDGQIKLLQADKLLDRLAGDYKGPAAEVRMKCKVETRSKDLRSLIFKAAKKADARMVMTGISSAPFYSVIAKEPIDSFYCSSAPLKELEALGAKVDGNSRFPNVEFIETDDELVYFDARKESNCMIASPVQSYLELWNSDKRARETAEQVRPKLLTGIDDYKGAKR